MQANNVTAFSTVVIMVFTGLALAIAGVTLDRTQRAWIAPAGLEIVGTPALGKPLTIKLKFENTGREPAREVVFAPSTAGLIPLREGHGDVPYIENFLWPRNSTCDAGPGAVSDATFFPSQSGRTYEDVSHVFVGGGPIRLQIEGQIREITTSSVAQEIFDKKVSFFIHGCIFYKTETIFSPIIFGELPQRRSAYCIYLLPVREKPFHKGVLSFCPVGNYAD